VFRGNGPDPLPTQWVTVTFDSPFIYQGGNIALVVADNRQAFPGSTYTFRTQVTTVNKATHLYCDANGYTGDPIYPSNIPTGTMGTSTVYTATLLYRNIVKFGACEQFYTLNKWDIYGEGAIVTLDPDPVPHGDDATVYFTTTHPCYSITDVIIDGESMGPIASYTFYNVIEPLPIIEVITYYPPLTSYNASHGENGTISPVGSFEVECGEQVIFDFTPDLGYTLDQVLWNGVRVNMPATTRKWTSPLIIGPGNTIHVTFRECPYHINITYNPVLGTVFLDMEGQPLQEIAPGPFGTDEGVMYNFKFMPNIVTSNLEAVYVDGALKPGAVISHSYLFAPIYGNHTMNVVFALKQYTITATAGVNGSITPAGNIMVAYGNAQQFDFTPNAGYVIDQVFVDQVENYAAVTNGFYLFENVTANHTIHVTFKRETYVITVSSEGCGNSSTEPTGPNVSVFHNEHQIIYFVPDVGCRVASVFVDGVSTPSAIPTGSYTFFYVTAPHSIHVVFEKIPYPITALINGNGTITDEGISYVEHGDNKTYTIVPRPGYKIANVFVDGVNNLAAVANGQYTFENVTAPHTISVLISLNTYTITATCGPNGIMNPVGVIPVSFGDNKSFTFAPAGGYEIDKVLIDGFQNDEAAFNKAYAFLNISANHTIEVTFKKIILFIRASAAGNGIIEPAGITEIPYGEEITYTIVPDVNFVISNVLVNGVDMGAISSYTFTYVDANAEIEASFAPQIGIIDPTLGITIYSQENVVYIKNVNHLPVQDVSISDMYGRIVWQGKPAGNTITLDVANGIYAVRVMTNDQFITTKVPINR
jgi:hypothetical protein